MSRPRARPRFGLHLTSGIVVDRRLSAAAKLRAGISAYLPGHDPSRRALERFLPFKPTTIVAAARELEALGLATIPRRRHPRDRLVVQPAGLALPGRAGRHRFATVGPDLAYAAFEAAGGRSAGYAVFVLQRLLREQLKRGSAHIAPAVLAADLGISEKLALALLDDLERVGVIDRHRSHRGDSDGLRVYSVPLGDELYPINVGELDEDQSRLVEQIGIEGHELTVIGRRRDLAALPFRLAELRKAIPTEAIEATIAAAVAANLTGPTMLASDLLDVLGTPQTASWDTTNGNLGHHKSALGTPPLKHQASSSKRYADDEAQDGQRANAEAAASAEAEELSGEEERVHRAPADTARAEAQRFEAPYCPVGLGYTATTATHERIAALLDAVAAAYGEGEAREAAYQAISAASADFKRGATGAAVLDHLKRRFDRLDPEQQEPDAGLDFGRIGEAA